MQLEEALAQKRVQVEELTASYGSIKDKHTVLQTALSNSEELLQTLQTGVASKEGQESGYQGKLHEARNKESTAATEQEQAKLKIAHLEKQIKEEEQKAKKAKEQNSDRKRREI